VTRILLVDDHPVVRRGVCDILSTAFPGAQVGEAGSAEEGLAEVRGSHWDVLVLDLTLPGPSGLDLLKSVRHEQPELPVLVLSMHPADQFARRVMNAGAMGYLSKDSAPGELIRAVAEVAAGRLYGSPDPRGKPCGDADRPHEALSDREYQVLRMLAGGTTLSQVAARLGLSVKTVSTYRARVLGKMNMKTTAELMHYGIRHNLAEQ
jgi:two-component system, NarL family, invasion response regulator UvrY